MSNQSLPDQSPATTPRRLWSSMALAAGAAALILVLFVLPAEYGIDVTGVGNVLGLNQLAAAPTKTIAVTDIIGGNEQLREVAIPDAGDPTPLPNPAVFQNETKAPETRTLQVVIPPEAETEVKVKMQAGKVVVFSWQTDMGLLYVDHHGHDPSFGPDFFVRYVEEQEIAGGSGSLTAPFAGEHGWYWLNFNEHPVTVTVTITGYFDEVIDYGIF